MLLGGNPRLALLLAITSIGVAPSAAAQPNDPARVEEAREHYQHGMDAVNDARWEEACEAFASAYELVPRPLILFNLGGAQMEAGRLVGALESYQRFLESAESESPEFVAEARAAVERLERSIPRVTLRAPGAPAGSVVRLDGDTVAASDLGTELPVDPGEHLAEVARGTDILASESFEVGDAERIDVDLEVELAPSGAGPFDADATTDDDDGSVLSSPWLWVAVGVVVIGGAVTAGVLLSGDDPADPHTGNLPPGGFRL
jgi:hypothetical protein